MLPRGLCASGEPAMKGSEGAGNVSSYRHQRVRPHRPQRAACHRRSGAHRYRGRRHQRSRPGRDQRASPALRFRARPPSREVTVKGDAISIGNGLIKVTAIKDPATLPWKDLGVDVALECTGIFTSKDKAAAHLAAGAKRVI